MVGASAWRGGLGARPAWSRTCARPAGSEALLRREPVEERVREVAVRVTERPLVARERLGRDALGAQRTPIGVEPHDPLCQVAHRTTEHRPSGTGRRCGLPAFRGAAGRTSLAEDGVAVARADELAALEAQRVEQAEVEARRAGVEHELRDALPDSGRELESVSR